MKNGKRVTLADISMTVLAAKILAERDLAFGYSNSGLGKGPDLQVEPDTLRQISQEIGVDITLMDRGTPDFPWEAEVRYGGVRFFCLVNRERLRILGYHVPGYQPDNPPVPVKIA